MKKVILFCLLSISFLHLFGQDVSYTKSDIAGRWVEVKETDKPGQYSETEYPYIYIFKDNYTFHLGESMDEVILFNITGKYLIENNSIDITYFEFLQNNNTKKLTQKKLSLQIRSIKNGIMTLYVSDYDFSYPLILKRQNLNR